MLVRESISFERYKDPKKALGLSLLDEVKERLEKFKHYPEVGYIRLAHPLEHSYFLVVTSMFYSTVKDFEKILEETGIIDYIEHINDSRKGTEYVFTIKKDYVEVFKELDIDIEGPGIFK